MSERDNECTQSWADASECHAYNNGICMNGIKCGGIPNYPPQPDPDLSALLKRCKPWLEQLRLRLLTLWRNSTSVTTIGQEWIKDDMAQLDALLSDIAKVEEGR